MEIFKKGHKINEDQDKSNLIHCLPKNSSKSSPTRTYTESEKIIMQRQSFKIVQLVVVNNRIFIGKLNY